MFVARGNDVFIVTADNVIAPASSATYVIVSDSGNVPTKVPLSQFIGANQWRHHPTTDLAAVQVEVSSQNLALLQNRCFPYDHMDLTSAAPSRDVELTALGFPLGLGASGHFSPLSFRTYAASGSISLPRFDKKTPCDFFLLETPGIGGYSGGPIFDLG